MGQVYPVEKLMGVLDELVPRLGQVSRGPEPLQGGITNRNFRVRFAERECVVRLPGKDTRLLGIDREAERLANQAAADLGIAPAVLAATEECLVTEYVNGHPLEAADVRAAPEAVGKPLRDFHDAGASLPVRFWVPELLDSYASVLADRGARPLSGYARAREIAARIAGVVQLRESVPCHNDLLPANVLSTGPGGAISLVDWEYAGMGHRFFDLGNLAVNAELTETEEARLLGAYLGSEPSSRDVSALRLMRLMSDAREAAWGVLQSVISELDYDFAGYADRHFARLFAGVEGPRFEEWLSAAAA